MAADAGAVKIPVTPDLTSFGPQLARGLQTSMALSQMLFQAAQGDREAETSLLTMLAQAMGQELGAQRDLQMFQQKLAAMDKESRRAFWGEVIGGGLSGIGSILGGKK